MRLAARLNTQSNATNTPIDFLWNTITRIPEMPTRVRNRSSASLQVCPEGASEPWMLPQSPHDALTKALSLKSKHEDGFLSGENHEQ